MNLDEHNELRDKIVAHAYDVVGYKPFHTTQALMEMPRDQLESMFRKNEEALFVVAGGKAWEYRKREALMVELEEKKHEIDRLEAVL